MDNHFNVTVSARGTATGFVAPYSGTVHVGQLLPGHYTVDFFVRPVTLLIVDGMEVEGYGPPVFAASAAFDVAVQGVPTLSWFALSVLLIFMTFIGGVYAAKRATLG